MNQVVDDLYWLSGQVKIYGFPPEDIILAKAIFLSSRHWKEQRKIVAIALFRMAIVKAFKSVF